MVSGAQGRPGEGRIDCRRPDFSAVHEKAHAVLERYGGDKPAVAAGLYPAGKDFSGTGFNRPGRRPALFGKDRSVQQKKADILKSIAAFGQGKLQSAQFFVFRRKSVIKMAVPVGIGSAGSGKLVFDPVYGDNDRLPGMVFHLEIQKQQLIFQRFLKDKLYLGIL